jgi:hypothetical protein
MSVSYWKIVGDNIAQGLGKKTIQRELAQWVDSIRPIESGYAARIYDCSQEIQKTLGSNVARAAISMATLGIVKKPEK